MTANESRPADARNGSHEVGGPDRIVPRRVASCLVIDLRRFVGDDGWLDLGLECPTYDVRPGVNVRLLIGDAIGQTGAERIASGLGDARIQIDGSNEYGRRAVEAALARALAKAL